MTPPQKDIIWISHRGLCQQADENTAASFSAAVNAGFHYLETDLRATKDGHIVLCHDPALERTASQATDISLTPRAQLASLRLNLGSKLLFLDEFYAQFGQLGHVFDIKPETGFEVIELLSQFNPNLEKTTFLLWDNNQQQQLLKRFPKANCFANEPQCRRAGFSTLVNLPFLGGLIRDKTYAVPPTFKGINLFKPQLVQRYHKYGAKVLAYLPETPEQTQMAIDTGVDYILSNHDFGLI
jgi:glycerophosphoryl diester phosphodiesterase